jgi:hypothetical protein
MIEDKDNYVIIGPGDERILAVHARKKEDYCGENATKYKYFNNNMVFTWERILVASGGWALPTLFFIAATNSLFLGFVPYVAHVLVIYSEHVPSYDPHNPRPPAK